MISTDACDKQLGCVLRYQRLDGHNTLFNFWSPALNNAERDYNTTPRECLDVLWAILLLPPHLEGIRFIIQTDHNAF